MHFSILFQQFVKFTLSHQFQNTLSIPRLAQQETHDTHCNTKFISCIESTKIANNRICHQNNEHVLDHISATWILRSTKTHFQSNTPQSRQKCHVHAMLALFTSPFEVCSSAASVAIWQIAFGFATSCCFHDNGVQPGHFLPLSPCRVCVFIRRALGAAVRAWKKQSLGGVQKKMGR